MTGETDFKRLSNIRIKTVKTLLKANDWDAAAYMIGFVLECSLKAVICKTLNFSTYPDEYGPRRDENIVKFFKTHEFQTLLTLSGMEDIFGYEGKRFRLWSEFTQYFPGNWTVIRYDTKSWEEEKVKNTYKLLRAILSIIKKEGRW